MAQSILIVDDERDIVSMLNQYFCKIGYVVYTAINGKEALNAITKHPDIILLDINMPDMNGFTICEKIRNFVSCPIIFLTARIEDCDVSYIEVSPKFTKHDRIVDSALGVVNIVTIPIVLSISMILCVTIFVNRKLVRPIKLLTNAYRKVENNELDFTLPYPYKDEMGRLCLAFEKMKNCLYQNNQKMIRQFTEQRRLNAAFSHDLRTPLTILKGHTTMLLSFIPKGLVSQQEVLDELSTVRNNVERLEKYVSAMTNLYRLEDIEIEKENINFDFLLKTLSNTTEMLCSDIEYTIKTNCNKQQTLFINLEIIIQIYENLLSNSIRYAKSMIAIDVNKQEEFLLITVSDDGCGFKSTDIERVTLPFYKPSQDTTSEHLGLGLNICKILCERHGGTIKISNNHKGGACVTACIKIAYVDEK